MNPRITPQQLARIVAVGLIVLAVLVAIIHSRRAEDAGLLASLEPQVAQSLATELQRCRTVAPEETAVLESCRRVWSENRRRFLAPAKSPSNSSLELDPDAPTPPAKIQDRFLPKEVERQQGEAR